MADTSAGGAGRRIILWFRNDLRLHDNAILHEAAERVKKGTASEVLPLYCFDPRNFGITPHGNPKTGAFRAQFQLESVAALREGLRAIGSDLAVHVGKPEEVIADCLGDAPGQRTAVLTQQEVTSEELDVDRQVKRALGERGQLELVWGPTMYHPADLPYSAGLQDLPDVFTPFRNKVEAKCQVRPPLPTPGPGALPLPASLEAGLLGTLPATVEQLSAALPPEAPKLATPRLHPNAVLDFRGGEPVALARLQHYLWGSDAIATYFDTRNGMLGGEYSTKFSPWLAAGCLSPRQVYAEVQRYQSERTSNKSTYWVLFELLWRDFFRFFAMKHGSALFHSGGTVGRRPDWQHSPEALQRWQEGRTGMPLVDANMREIAATGFMSNRGRQNVASYLALDLQLDWRAGADWFEYLLHDYDVCSNWGNWVAAAGLTGGRINRFNITKQSKDYDLQGDYIRTWVPELAKLPGALIHEPWRLSREDQARFGVRIGVDYPAPLQSLWDQKRDAYGTGRAPPREQRGGPQQGRGNGQRAQRKRYDRGGARAKVSEFDRYG